MIDVVLTLISSMSDAAIVVDSPPREMSRTTTLSFACSTSNAASDFPSAVMTVTDSNPLRMTFDGSSTDSTSDSSETSLPSVVRSGPSEFSAAFPTA